MKKLIYIIIAISFIFACVSAGMGLSEYYFEKGKIAEKKYLWKRAEKYYKYAVKLNPLDAKYLEYLGKICFLQSKYRKNKSEWFDDAERYFKKANEINPVNPEYFYFIGKIELERMVTDGDNNSLREKKIIAASAVSEFENTISLDPFNLRNNYNVGMDLVENWSLIDQSAKALAKKCLKYVLKLRDDYRENVSLLLLKHFNDFDKVMEIFPDNIDSYKFLYMFIDKYNLWENRKLIMDKIDLYECMDQPEFDSVIADINDSENWSGTSFSGNKMILNGKMYWEGIVSRRINISERKSTISIQARGEQAKNVWPYMIVKLNDEEIGETYVNSNEWKTYDFKVEVMPGEYVLSIIFVNDETDVSDKSIDRNLYVGNVEVAGDEQ